MKVTKITESMKPKLVDGTLPDIDTDFAGRDRAEIKAYMERRFGRAQICSVGTHTTMKLKGLLKDLSKTANVDFSQSNLVTAIIDDNDSSFKDLIVRASTEPKLKAFIKDHSDLIYMIPSLLNQPKTQSIHPCAVIVFPSVMSASEWVPTRLQQGLIISEWGGNEMDDAGFLKDDILGIKQLDKFIDILNLIKKNGKDVPDIYNLPHDNEVYRYFSNGWNGDVFQFGSTGLTEYCKALKPRSMEDLIAANALYRPGPMENGYHTTFAKCKNEGKVPEFLWGTKEITKDTFGLLVYQEQIMAACHEVGGLTKKESDDVRRAMGKQKLKDLLKWKSKVQAGFTDKGCDIATFEEVWNVMLEFAKYSFNKSHSAAYAKTGYASQYLKVHYPIEYWTVALSYADEKKNLTFLSEILQAKQIKIKAPDINESGISMSSNQASSTVFWGIESIKGIGEDTAMQIVNERKLNGKYTSFASFFFRHNFKGSKVKKQTFEALVTCGAFDELYGFKDCESRRMLLVNRYRKYKKVKISNPTRDKYLNGKVYENWWWKLQQKNLTGLAFFDYKELAEEKCINPAFCSLSELTKPQERGIFRTFGGYVVECKVARSKNGQYAKLLIEHNYKLFKVLIWSEEYSILKDKLKGCEKSLIVFSGELRYDPKWSKANQFTFKENSQLEIM